MIHIESVPCLNREDMSNANIDFHTVFLLVRQFGMRAVGMDISHES